jgi:hypothetical protein
MMAPAISLLEHTAASTIQRDPETGHERTFHAEFREELLSAVESLRGASSAAVPGDAPAALEPFKQLAARIQERCRHACPFQASPVTAYLPHGSLQAFKCQIWMYAM